MESVWKEKEQIHLEWQIAYLHGRQAAQNNFFTRIERAYAATVFGSDGIPPDTFSLSAEAEFEQVEAAKAKASAISLRAELENHH